MTPADLGLLILGTVLLIALFEIRFGRFSYESLDMNYDVFQNKMLSTETPVFAVWAWQRRDGSLKTDNQGRALLYKNKPRYQKGTHGCLPVLLSVRGEEGMT